MKPWLPRAVFRVSILAVCLVAQLPAQTPQVLEYTPGKQFWRTARNCGVNCMYLMLRAHGEGCDYDELLAATEVEEQGSTPTQLRDGAARLGFATEVVRAGPADVARAHLPVVLYLTEFSDKMGEAGHFVVLTDVSEDGQRAHVFDGTTAMSGEIPMAKLRRSWTGIVVRRVSTPERIVPWAAVGFLAFGVLCWLFPKWWRRRRDARATRAMAAAVATVVLLTVTPGHAQRADGGPRTSSDESAWTIRYRVTRSSPLPAHERADRGVPDEALTSSKCEFRYDRGKWTFLQTRGESKNRIEETLFYDGAILFKHDQGSPAMVLDRAGIEGQLEPRSVICRVEYLDWAGWATPTTPITLGSALTRAHAPRSPDVGERITDVAEDGDVRSSWFDAGGERLESWVHRSALGNARVRATITAGRRAVEQIECSDWRQVGGEWWPFRVTRSHFQWGAGPGPISKTPILVERAEVTHLSDRCPDLGHDRLQPAAGTVVYDSRHATKDVGRQGLVGYVVPHDPDYLFDKLREASPESTSSTSALKWWLLGAGVLVAILAALLRTHRRSVRLGGARA